MPPKNIIVCCDGTWNRPDQGSKDGKPCPTNVAKLFEAITPFDANGTPQVVHYIPGVGTNFRDRIKGGGFGYGISDNIKSGYKAICSNYEDGDRIFLFGFSRGAYSARSIGGLIDNMGIIRRVNFYLIDEAYRRYRDKSPEWQPGKDKALAFQNKFSWPRKDIHFLGVWDTVGALGAPYGVILGWLFDKIFHCGFHNTQLNDSTLSAAHALAIDEHRWPFRPTLWTLGKTQPSEMFEERWFPGVHSDVGGGYPGAGLSDIVLDWMAGKACARGLCLDLRRVPDRGVAPNPKQDPHHSQALSLRIATLLFVKIPAALGIPLPGIAQADIDRINWKGDYKRAITPGASIGHEVKELTHCGPDQT